MRFVDERRYLSTGVGVRGSVEALNAHLIQEQRRIMVRRVAHEQAPLEKKGLAQTKIRRFARLGF